jgi:hypothetical protein
VTRPGCIITPLPVATCAPPPPIHQHIICRAFGFSLVLYTFTDHSTLILFNGWSGAEHAVRFNRAKSRNAECDMPNGLARW